MALESFASLCDDFYVDMYVNTELDLPTQRDTILAFFERVQKQYPSMGKFYRGESSDYCLEEDSGSGHYRWVSLETERIGSGVVNPSSLEEVYTQDKMILEIMPYMLGVSHLDIDALDVTFAMDFDYFGNHDEIIADAFFASTAFGSLLEIPSAKPVSFSPTVVVALSDDCQTQARLSIESKTSSYEQGKQKYNREEAISLSFTIRQYPPGNEKFDAMRSFENQCRLAEELMAEKIVPNFVRPLINVIAEKRLR